MKGNTGIDFGRGFDLPLYACHRSNARLVARPHQRHDTEVEPNHEPERRLVIILSALTTSIVLIGVGWAFGSASRESVHVCANKKGALRGVDAVNECRPKETTFTLATEAAIQNLEASLSAVQDRFTAVEDRLPRGVR